jgi:hypothetical protein
MARELTDAEYAKEMANLAKLEKFMGQMETAEFLYDCAGPSAITTALKRIQEKRDNEDLPENDSDGTDTEDNGLSLKSAMKNTPNSREKPTIVLGANKTKILDTRVKFNCGPALKNNSGKAFASAGKSIASAQKSLADSFIDDHRGVNWINPERERATKNHVRIVKDAVKKSLANRAACEAEYFGLTNEKAIQILCNRKALQESLTPAQASIVPHKMASEASVRAKLPKEFLENPLSAAQRQRDVNDVTAETTSIRVKDYGTRQSLPPEFAAIKPSQDNSYKAISGRMKSDTAAGRSLDKGKPDFRKSNPEQTDQGEVAKKLYGNNDVPKPADSATNVPGQDTYKEPFQNKTREGQWPADPANPWCPEETASNRKQMTRW